MPWWKVFPASAKDLPTPFFPGRGNWDAEPRAGFPAIQVALPITGRPSLKKRFPRQVSAQQVRPTLESRKAKKDHHEQQPALLLHDSIHLAELPRLLVRSDSVRLHASVVERLGSVQSNLPCAASDFKVDESFYALIVYSIDGLTVSFRAGEHRDHANRCGAISGSRLQPLVGVAAGLVLHLDANGQGGSPALLCLLSGRHTADRPAAGSAAELLRSLRAAGSLAASPLRPAHRRGSGDPSEAGSFAPAGGSASRSACLDSPAHASPSRLEMRLAVLRCRQRLRSERFHSFPDLQKRSRCDAA
jgi:hypothetical protein